MLNPRQIYILSILLKGFGLGVLVTLGILPFTPNPLNIICLCLCAYLVYDITEELKDLED